LWQEARQPLLRKEQKMGSLIEDIKPHKPFTMTSGRMIKKLWERGVTIEEIFGIYYALEEMASARDDEIFGNDEDGQHGRPRLTVGDALLVTPTPPPKRPVGEAPF
jgi:hypothetical protein